jgi:hypothetical protein
VSEFNVVSDDDIGARAGELAGDADALDARRVVRLSGTEVERDLRVALVLLGAEEVQHLDVVDEA